MSTAATVGRGPTPGRIAAPTISKFKQLRPTRCSPGATRTVFAKDGVAALSTDQACPCPASITAAGVPWGGGSYFGSAFGDVEAQPLSKVRIAVETKVGSGELSRMRSSKRQRTALKEALRVCSRSDDMCALTVKLRGRPEAPDQAPRAHTVFSARGADIQTVHGPLQRLLAVAGPTIVSAPLAHAVGTTGTQTRPRSARISPQVLSRPE